jgi:hypothetical protein
VRAHPLARAMLALIFTKPFQIPPSIRTPRFFLPRRGVLARAFGGASFPLETSITKKSRAYTMRAGPFAAPF